LVTLEEVRKRAESDAKTHGYYLSPDPEFLNDLLEGLKKNEERYGYPSCPCRLASGVFELDRDIICPCDYRDPDVIEYNACYCALYVSKEAFEGKVTLEPIPERRPLEKQNRAYGLTEESLVEKAPEKPPEKTTVVTEESGDVKMKMWYCKQCGYVCFREEPPYVCPICKAKREMFAEISMKTQIQG